MYDGVLEVTYEADTSLTKSFELKISKIDLYAAIFFFQN